ncbi:O-antigen polymerase [Acinetobacter towneri]|uniref:O-antigen polymerase n=1 Tax=Acinetobacter towneri TaxID=202956 RepID=UPI0032126423
MNYIIIVSLFICTGFLVFQIKNFYNKDINPISLLYLLFYFVFIFPLFLDFIFDIPDYDRYYGFKLAINDNLVNLLYCFFILVCSGFFYFFKGKVVFSIGNLMINKNKFLFLFVISILPILYFMTLPNIVPYSIYGTRWVRQLNDYEVALHSNLVILTFLSCIAAAYLLVTLKKSYLLKIFLIFVVICDIWFNGKRIIYLLFVTCFSCFYIFNIGKINYKSVAVVFSLVISFFIFSSWYQNNVRDYDEKLFEDKYQTFRIDYFRDQRVKMALYSTLYPKSMEILEYPGQSYLFTIGAYIPRSLWDSKPYPYAHYFTSAMLNSPPGQRDWTMTTSWFDEFISNFGLLGIFFGPIAYIYLVRVGMRKNNFFMQLLTLLLGAIYLYLHMLTFAILLYAWIFMFFKTRFRVG